VGKNKKWLSLHTKRKQRNFEELFSTALGVKAPWFVKRLVLKRKKRS